MPDATEVVLPFYDFVLNASFLHSVGGYNPHDTATYDGHIGLRAIDGRVRTVPVHGGHHLADTLCTTNFTVYSYIQVFIGSDGEFEQFSTPSPIIQRYSESVA